MQSLNVCIWCTMMAWCPTLGVFLPYSQTSQIRLWIHHNPDQNKVVSKDE